MLPQQRCSGIQGSKRLAGRVQEFLRGVVVLLGQSQEVGAAGCHGFMGEVDRAELVLYADSFANFRVLLLTD
jgi:hypothetical protein